MRLSARAGLTCGIGCAKCARRWFVGFSRRKEHRSEDRVRFGRYKIGSDRHCCCSEPFSGVPPAGFEPAHTAPERCQSLRFRRSTRFLANRQACPVTNTSRARTSNMTSRQVGRGVRPLDWPPGIYTPVGRWQSRAPCPVRRGPGVPPEEFTVCSGSRGGAGLHCSGRGPSRPCFVILAVSVSRGLFVPAAEVDGFVAPRAPYEISSGRVCGGVCGVSSPVRVNGVCGGLRKGPGGAYVNGVRGGAEGRWGKAGFLSVLEAFG